MGGLSVNPEDWRCIFIWNWGAGGVGCLGELPDWAKQIHGGWSYLERLRMSLESVFEALCMLAIATLLIAFVSRIFLVWELRRNSPELWDTLGRPAILERDHFLTKYPICGWKRVHNGASGVRKLFLLVFWFSFLVYLISLIPLIVIWIMR